MDVLFAIFAAILDQLVQVLRYPLDPEQRIYWAYLLTSLLTAYGVYRAIRLKGDGATKHDAEAAKNSFVAFLFPKSVWSHPSAWLDLRYFFFHRIAKHFLLLGIGAFSLALGYHYASGGQYLTEIATKQSETTVGDLAIAVVYMFFAFLVTDFIAWAIHFFQHKVPLLWQFHKVHHSAEVMHPISNYREHPVDNLFYGGFISFAYGVVFGLAEGVFGYVPTLPTLFGVPLLMFLFNVLGYNLRHSHVWLRWPGVWSVIFPSPAHHHVHHSCYPDHIDKNFAFMFPIWDVIFGTYIMPDDNRDVKFGVPEEQGRDLDGVFRLYWVPFRDAFRLFFPKEEEKAEARNKDAPKMPAE